MHDDNVYRSVEITGSSPQGVTEAIDRVQTTGASHGRVMLVETMGRNAGWIALEAGLAGGADAILLPQFPFELERLVEFLAHRAEYQNAIRDLVLQAYAEFESQSAVAS